MINLPDFEENFNFTLSPEINGPVLAIALGILTVIVLAINLFVLIHSFCHPKVFKQPSIIFLTNFILVNILTALLYQPFSIVTAVYGEWIIGTTVIEKTITCMSVGFLSSFIAYLTCLTLTTMSVDRFLFIVKPLFYKAYMKTWLAVLVDVLLWILSGVLSVPPIFGIGQFSFEMFGSNCFVVFRNNLYFLTFSFTMFFIFLVTIAVTSVWTYLFTRKYIKKFGYEPLNVKENKLYKKRKRKLTGIFGTLLLVTGLCYTPLMIAAFVGIINGLENTPGEVFTASLFFLYMNIILNPIVQSYFRKDLNDFIVLYCKKFCVLCRCVK